MLKIFLFVILCVSISIAYGIFIGATDFNATFKTVKWTDVGSLTVTILGFLIAFFSYYRWLSNKKKDDAYQVAKNYLYALDKFRDQVQEFDFQYHYMCPAEGRGVESVEITEQRIQHVSQLYSQLFQLKNELINARCDLDFWGVALSADWEVKHQSFLKEVRNIHVVVISLNSQLYHFYLKKIDNMHEIIRHKELFDTCFANIKNIIDERMKMGFERMFQFK